MLSNPLHRFPSYQAFPVTNMLPNGHLPSSHMHAAGLDNLGHGGQYAFQQLQRHIDIQQSSQGNRTSHAKHRQHPYGLSGGAGSRVGGGSGNSSGPVRRRISRACDQCNQLRTKCDGQNPCAHCVEFNLGCEYVRERKKRGKASRKDLAQQAAAAAAAAAVAAANGQKSPNGPSSDERSPAESRHDHGSSMDSSTQSEVRMSESRSMSLNDTNSLNKMLNGVNQRMSKTSRAKSLGTLSELPHPQQQQLMGGTQDNMISHEQVVSPTDIGLNGYGSMHGYRAPLNAHLLSNGGSISYATPTSLPGYTEIPYTMQSPPNYPVTTQSPGTYRLEDSPLPGFALTSPGSNTGWTSMPSPLHPSYHMTPQPQVPVQVQAHTHTHTQHNNFTSQPRYPVLQPLVPHLGNIVPLSLACDLLDLYFASSSPTQMHPLSPYVLGYVFRKQSFLHPTKPRLCSPALLASMLWVAAQTSDAAFLAAPPSARGRVCQRLLELTVGLLKPLIHSPATGDASQNFVDAAMDGAALGGLGVAMPGSVGTDPNALNGEAGAFGAAGILDDVVTYIHLATVVSASEYKGASLRWWNAAWSLARELKLGRELPAHHSAAGDVDADGEADDDLEVPHASHGMAGGLGEEEREERRRIWWLVYAVDRHLSLCCNKPLFLMDVECDGLLQPMDDAMWQAGNFYSGDSSIHITSPNRSTRIRRRGPNFECTGHSIFGYFLPLMTILGEIVDLNHAKNHPRFGVGFRSAQEWNDHTNEITLQLEAYERSLKDFEQHADDEHAKMDLVRRDHHGVTSPSSASRFATESELQTRLVVAYGTHVMHVLHVLLAGRWDPISLLDDHDAWVSSPTFLTAMGHAVSAAQAVDAILDLDPGLDHMPFFFSIYLLQDSFLLLLVADKLQTEASPSVVKACETLARGHEACAPTLSAEYQTNLRHIMRSAVAQLRDGMSDDFGEQLLRRREVLSLYRWTGDGTGLAL